MRRSSHAMMPLDSHLGHVEQDTHERYLGNASHQMTADAAGKPNHVVNPGVMRVPNRFASCPQR
jgi:hypothetical protein